MCTLDDKTAKRVDVHLATVLSYRSVAYKMLLAHTGLMLAIVYFCAQQKAPPSSAWIVFAQVTTASVVTALACWWFVGLVRISRNHTQEMWTLLGVPQEPRHKLWDMAGPAVVFLVAVGAGTIVFILLLANGLFA